MKITPCLLDKDNQLTVDGISLGRRICSSGKDHLWEERAGSAIDTIVIHYTSASAVLPATPYDLAAILKIFCDYGVSSHYLVNRRGAVHQLVPEDKKAWHCGGSIMPEPDNRRGVNEFSIGIEFVATATSGFTPSQYRSAALLCAELEKRRKNKFIYTGHDRIADVRAVALGLRKDVKVDPGRMFDWGNFYGQLETARKSFF
jgi:N-acetyl-anhydromuramyl-L-alanine amidase AmpD